MDGISSLWILSYFPGLSSWISVLAFLAPIIGGADIGVVAVSVIFANGFSTFATIVIFSFLGMITSDSIWFYVARSKWFRKFRESKRVFPKYKSLENSLEKITKSDVLIIMLAKIMVGTRILIILYLGARKITYARYFVYNLLPNFIWATILVGLGFMASKGFSSATSLFNNIQFGITFLIVFFFILYGLQKWIRRKLLAGKVDLEKIN